MKTILIALLVFVGGYQNDTNPPRTDVEAVLTQVLNHPELDAFIYPYVKTLNVLYFRFLPSPVYSDQSLENLKDIVIKIKDSPPLAYDKYQDEKQKPIVRIKIMKMTQDTAQVRIGFPIEGAVGVFTLIKRDTWIITEGEVYVI
jgi:hypothetical protein